jgi:hypothetical protein
MEGRRQWRIVELTFVAEKRHAEPATGVALAATFEGPGDLRYEVPGFWDGGDTWKVRFTPTTPGRWRYTSHCTVKEDEGLHGREGTLRVLPADAENPLFEHGGFLRVSENGRYLTYADGTPFFWLGDTWWFCPSDRVPYDGSSNPAYDSMYKTLIDTRAGQGYTVVQWAFQGSIEKSSTVNTVTDFGILGRIDPAYWQNVDRYVDYANQAGIIPVIGLAFHSGFERLDLEQWQFLWRYVIARYGAHAITWLIGGEYNADIGRPEQRVPMVLELGQYIKDTDPYKRAMTVHPWWYQGDRRQAWDQPWYDFIMLQGGHDTYPSASVYLEAYNSPDPKPVLEGECNYEGIHAMTAADVRAVAYCAMQSGSFGYTYGAHGLWYPTQDETDKTFDEWGKPIPWWEALAMPGGEQMGYLRAFYESVGWWALVPRPDAVSMPPGYELRRVLVRAEEDRTFVVYFPRALPETMDIVLQGPEPGASYAAVWNDPRTAETIFLSPPLVAGKDGVRLPGRPDRQDWLLVLRKE